MAKIFLDLDAKGAIKGIEEIGKVVSKNTSKVSKLTSNIQDMFSILEKGGKNINLSAAMKKNGTSYSSLSDYVKAARQTATELSNQKMHDLETLMTGMNRLNSFLGKAGTYGRSPLAPQIKMLQDFQKKMSDSFGTNELSNIKISKGKPVKIKDSEAADVNKALENLVNYFNKSVISYINNVEKSISSSFAQVDSTAIKKLNKDLSLGDKGAVISSYDEIKRHLTEGLSSYLTDIKKTAAKALDKANSYGQGPAFESYSLIDSIKSKLQTSLDNASEARKEKFLDSKFKSLNEDYKSEVWKKLLESQTLMLPAPSGVRVPDEKFIAFGQQAQNSTAENFLREPFLKSLTEKFNNLKSLDDFRAEASAKVSDSVKKHWPSLADEKIEKEAWKNFEKQNRDFKLGTDSDFWKNYYSDSREAGKQAGKQYKESFEQEAKKSRAFTNESTENEKSSKKKHSTRWDNPDFIKDQAWRRRNEERTSKAYYKNAVAAEENAAYRARNEDLDRALKATRASRGFYGNLSGDKLGYNSIFAGIKGELFNSIRNGFNANLNPLDILASGLEKGTQSGIINKNLFKNVFDNPNSFFKLDSVANSATFEKFINDRYPPLDILIKQGVYSKKDVLESFMGTKSGDELLSLFSKEGKFGESKEDKKARNQAREQLYKDILDSKEDKALLMGDIAKNPNMLKKLGNSTGVAGVAINASIVAVKKLAEGIKALGTEAVKSYEGIETLKTQLGVVFSSRSQSNQMFEQIEAYAKKSPFGVETMTQQAVLLKQSGVYAEDLMDTMKRIGDLASGNNQRMRSISEVYARVKSSTTVTARDMRQLSNAGIPSYEALAAATGIPKGDIRSRLQAGKITSEDFERMIKNLTDKGGMFYNATEIGARTLASRKQNLSDSKDMARAALGEFITSAGGISQQTSFYSKVITLLEGIYAKEEEVFKEKNTEKTAEAVNKYIKKYVGEKDEQKKIDLKENIKSTAELSYAAQSTIYEAILNNTPEGLKYQEHLLDQFFKLFSYPGVTNEEILSGENEMAAKDFSDFMFDYRTSYQFFQLGKQASEGVTAIKKAVDALEGTQAHQLKAKNQWESQSDIGRLEASDKEWNENAIIKERVSNFIKTIYDETLDNYNFGKLSLKERSQAEQDMLVSGIELDFKKSSIWDEFSHSLTEGGKKSFKLAGEQLESLLASTILSGGADAIGEEQFEVLTKLVSELSKDLSHISNDSVDSILDLFTQMSNFADAMEGPVGEAFKMSYKRALTKSDVDVSGIKDLNRRKSADLWAQVLSSATGIDAASIQTKFKGSGAMNIMAANQQRNLLSTVTKTMLQQGRTMEDISRLMSSGYKGTDAAGRGVFDWKKVSTGVETTALAMNSTVQQSLIDAYQAQIDALDNLTVGSIATADTWAELQDNAKYLGSAFTLAGEEMADGSYRFTEATIRAADEMRKELSAKKFQAQLNSLMTKMKEQLAQQYRGSVLTNYALEGRIPGTAGLDAETRQEAAKLLSDSIELVVNQEAGDVERSIKDKGGLENVAGFLSYATGRDYSVEGERSVTRYRNKNIEGFDDKLFDMALQTADHSEAYQEQNLNKFKALVDSVGIYEQNMKNLKEGTAEYDANKNARDKALDDIKATLGSVTDKDLKALYSIYSGNAVDKDFLSKLQKTVEKVYGEGTALSVENGKIVGLKESYQVTDAEKIKLNGQIVTQEDLKTEINKILSSIKDGSFEIEDFDKLLVFLDYLGVDTKEALSLYQKNNDILKKNKVAEERENIYESFLARLRESEMLTASERNGSGDTPLSELTNRSRRMRTFNSVGDELMLESLGYDKHMDINLLNEKLRSATNWRLAEGADERFRKHTAGIVDENSFTEKYIQDRGGFQTAKDFTDEYNELNEEFKKVLESYGAQGDTDELFKKIYYPYPYRSKLDFSSSAGVGADYPLQPSPSEVVWPYEGLFSSASVAGIVGPQVELGRSSIESILANDEFKAALEAYTKAIEDLKNKVDESTLATETYNTNLANEAESSWQSVREESESAFDDDFLKKYKPRAEVLASYFENDKVNADRVFSKVNGEDLLWRSQREQKLQEYNDAHGTNYTLTGDNEETSIMAKMKNLKDASGNLDIKKVAELEALLRDMGVDTDDIVVDFNKIELASNSLEATMLELGDTIKDAFKDFLKGALLDSTEALGKSMYKVWKYNQSSEETTENVTKALQAQEAQMLKTIAGAATEAGFRLVATGAASNDMGLVAKGLALAAAGGVGSFMAGVLSASSEDKDDKDDSLERLEKLRDNLADLLKQARDDAKYYEETLANKSAIATNQNVSDSVTRVNDMIITPSGQFSTAPDDYILAMKKPQALASGGTPNVNFTVVNESGTPMTVQSSRQSTDSNGNLQIEVVLKEIVSNGIANGEFDDAFALMNQRQKGTLVSS